MDCCDISVCLAFVLGLLTFIYFYLTWNFDYWKKQGIPFDKPLPIIGSLNISKRFEEQDIDSYKKYGRLFGIYEGSSPALVVGDPELLKQLLLKDFYTAFTNHRQFELSAKQATFEKMLLNMKDEDWKAVRSVITPVFTSGKLKQMLETMQDLVVRLDKHLAEYAQKKESINVFKHFKALTLDIIAECVFGVSINSIENPNNDFIQNSQKLSEVSSLGTLAFLCFPKLVKWLPGLIDQNALDYFENRIREIIKLRKENKEGKKCFVDLLLQAQEEEEASEGNKKRKKNTTSDVLLLVLDP